MDETFMKERPVFRLVLSMSLPMVLSMLVSSLYNIVDSYYVARISENAMTALSLVFPLQNVVTAVTIGFGIGVNAAIAFYLGAGQQEKADTAASLGIVFSILHGLVLTLICQSVIGPFLRLYTGDEATLSYALAYSRIVFSFAVIVALGMTFEKIFQSVGRMVMTMVCLLASCLTNIILDPILIFGLGPFPRMGMQGAALATGIGQTVTVAGYLIFCAVRPLPVRIRAGAVREGRPLLREITKRLYTVGIPAALNMALTSVMLTILNGILAAFSEASVLVLGVYYKLQTFLYLTANGIVQGIRPLVGYNYGAGEHGRVRRIYLVALGMSAVIMAVGTVLCQAVPERLFGLFTENPETVQMGAKALRVISAGFLVSSVSVISCGALEGLGKGFPSLLITLLRYLVLMVPAAFFLSRLLGPDGVWHAFWVTEWVSAAASLFIYRRSTARRKEVGRGGCPA